MNTGAPETRLIDNRFELMERLGGGGMGLVWRARDTMLHREVALKEVRPPDPAMAAADPTAADELRERVLREARALARLQHPNVAVIHHIVDTPGHPHPWLVMELVTGGSLAERIARGPLSVPEAARIGRGVLAALRAAHAAGIQHRDVKPGNVLLRADGTPVLTDFGIAAMQDATALTATGALIGSPEYIAPERIRGEEGNPSSDLWSLGMLLYVAVEGHHPLRRATTLATLAAVLDEPLPPPTRCGPLGPVLAALLARDPAVRPDAAQLDRALAAAEAGAAPGGPQPSWSPAPPDAAHPYAGQPPAGPYPGAPSGSSPHPYAGPHPHPHPHPYAEPSSGVFVEHSSGTAYLPGPGDDTGTELLGATGPAATPPPPARRRTGATVTLAVAGVALASVLAWTLRPDGTGDAADPGAAPNGSSAPAAAGGSPTAQDAAASSGPAAAPSGTASVAPPAAGTAAGTAAAGTGTASAAPTVKPPAKPSKDLLTPDGVRTAVAAITAQSGGTKVKSLNVYATYASAQVPTADGRNYDWYDYRDGKVTKRAGGPMGKDKPVDLAQYDWDVVPALLKKAEETLNVKDPSSRYLVIDTFPLDNVATIRVYLSNEYHNSGYLVADTKGTLRHTYPAD
ncbi:serine/threonine-protein kinase [Kitasatospora sp. NPDC015120]|uniref:serine/threonine-protein kinase n=1 Tax=Kitasatospora sp. NPDC015120 TaxID=3364023 RepID=UPI0036F4880D